MANLKLWNQYNEWMSECKWVDLTHELSEATTHWSGFSPMSRNKKFDYDDGFLVHEFHFVSQYGTHVDAPSHFVQGMRPLEQIKPEEMILPLCVIDVSELVKENVDFAMGVEDIKAWEEIYGKLPEGAFVAMRSDWSKRSDLDNCDADGNKHYPGWSLESLKFLVEERNVGAIGHESSDTDAAVDSAKAGSNVCEYYILEQNRYQIELMAHLDEVPPVGSLIFCGFPKAKDAPGFPARCIALCPKE